MLTTDSSLKINFVLIIANTFYLSPNILSAMLHFSDLLGTVVQSHLFFASLSNRKLEILYSKFWFDLFCVSVDYGYGYE